MSGDKGSGVEVVTLTEYNEFKKQADKKMAEMSISIEELEKQLGMLHNIVAMSRYINDCMLGDDFLDRMNVIITSMFDITNSTIYLYDRRKLALATTTLDSVEHHVDVLDSVEHSSRQKFFKTAREDLYDGVDTRTIIGVPVRLKSELLGYLIAETPVYAQDRNSTTEELLELISNQIAIGLENNKLYRELMESADRDALTTLYNRRYFFREVRRRLQTSTEGYSIVMMDIDNFKKCNDNHGHQFGDKVLVDISTILKNSVRKDDIVARYGGEEIVVFLYGMANADCASQKADGLRKEIEERIITLGDIQQNVTVSVGVCTNVDNKPDLDSTINKADMMLYKSKNTGKNKVTTCLA